MEKTIKDIMLEEHSRLAGIFNKFEQNLGKDYELIIIVFDEFRWELEKHLFIEEKAIFRFFSPEKRYKSGYNSGNA